METLEAWAKGLSEAQREAIEGAHRLSAYTSARAIYHETAMDVVQQLCDLNLCWGNRVLRSPGLALRAHLIAQKDHTPS